MSNPNFSSGPCSKRPGWTIKALEQAATGRSHRGSLCMEKLRTVINKSKNIIGLPGNYLLGIFPGSDTGAFEAALWTLLGPKPVTVLVWESFSKGWAADVAKQLKLNPTVLTADYGKIPDLSEVDWSNDVVFVANGTTSGVRVPDWNWIPDDRKGLAICDATSALFAMLIDWTKIDVLTYSWQKCLGGEAAHGMLVLGPRAVHRIETYDPPWPLPKIFRMKKEGTVDKSIFEGSTINTPSMLCVEDCIDSLTWAEKQGLDGLAARTRNNYSTVKEWVARTDWVDFLAESEEIRSTTSICLKIVDPAFQALPKDEKSLFIKTVAGELSKTAAAHDIGSYKDAPPGFRLWCGPTIETSDIPPVLAALDAAVRHKLEAFKQRS
ncbi:MAG: phosphoserine transaminase [Deltaproteobacteria bacterium]|nr:phosphoserine transaminase [Deltaproteobacteria bacterium]